MERRPNAREGVVLPKFAAVMAALFGLGVLAIATDKHPFAVLAGQWLVGLGLVGLVTAGLVFWRVGQGGLIAAPLWLGYAGAVAVQFGALAGAGRWLIGAGALLAGSLLVVGVNRPIGGGVTAGAWLIYAGLLMRTVPAEFTRTWWWAAVSLGALVAVATVARVVMSRSTSRGLLRRLGRAGRTTDGLASSVDVYRAGSARVLRRKASQVRPSLAGVSWWARRRVRLVELGTRIARVGLVVLRVSYEDHTIVFGGPRKGKTQHLINAVLDAPGAVITTSTKQDILRLTRDRRSRRGPIWVFDPSGLTEHGSTITFDPLTGCQDPAVAMDRAADLIDGVGRSSTGDGERWDGFAKQTLQSLLHAAALGGYSMRDVQQWVAYPGKDAEAVVLYQLKMAGPGAAGMVQEATQFFQNNPATQSSISTGIMPALSWLSVPAAVSSAAPGGEQFDVRQLLDTGGTVYLIGAEDKKTAPLVTALTAHIARQAKDIAARAPGERLDPPLKMVLDEAALICLIPLDVWSGDFGSRGIPMDIAAQSRAQMRQRFGDAATGALLTNTHTKILFGGTGDDDDLQYWSTLAGEREEPAITRDRSTGSQSVTTRKVPVLTPGQVRELRTGQVLIISDGMPPAITKARMAYKRLDVRLDRFRRRRTVRAVSRGLGWLDQRGGDLLVAQCRWIADQAADGAVRIDDTTRRLLATIREPASAALSWAALNDPVQALVSRVRLGRATRKARAALAAREAAPRELTASRADSERGQR